MSIDFKGSEKKLSRAVLDLKFMKKSKEKREILDDAEERQQLYKGQLSMLHEGADRIVMLSSYVDCMKFLPCRLSFGGMDPEVEKLNQDKLIGLYKDVRPASSVPSGENITGMDADVDEEEMAESCLTANIRKKFGIKRKSQPDDDDFQEDGHQDKKVALGGDDKKKFRGPKACERSLLRGPIGGGRGDLRGRGRGDFRGRGRGDSRGRGRGDSRGRGRGDSRGRGRGDFSGRGRRDFQGRGRGDFRGRGRGDFPRRGTGGFQGRGGASFQEGERRDFKEEGRNRFQRPDEESEHAETLEKKFVFNFHNSDNFNSNDLEED
ncbi:bromodomain and WD repeat-containing protein 3-like [Macrobrachium nipponense]|uniref:bromodomain and WD repeat-containing protein 3-like n=1 Tax=Macrobrachium nipponense TaxID=159736 RepID=UPI0030C83654